MRTTVRRRLASPTAAALALVLSACAGPGPATPSGAAAAPGQATAGDAAAALARLRQWSGGDAWNALRALSCTGELQAAGLRGRVAVALTVDGRGRETFDLGTYRGAEGIDGAGGWKQNASGQIEPLTAVETARWQRRLQAAFGRHLLPAAAAAARYVRADAVDGTPVDVVRLPDDGGPEVVELWIARDGALCATETIRGQDRQRSVPADWRAVAGVRMPFAEVTSGANAQTVHWTRIEAVAEPAAAELARPVPVPTTVAAGALPAVLPLDLYEGRYLYVRGRLGDVDTDILVDSGAGITVVDAELARAVGLQGTGEVTARGAGGEGRRVQLAGGVHLRLGDLELPPLTVAILDLGEVHQRLGRRMPVILGKELFHGFPVTVDYAQKRLVVHDPAHFAPPAGAVELPVRPVDDGHVMVELQLEDLPKAWCMVDTGSGDTVLFHSPYVREQNLLTRWPRYGEQLYSGVGGALVAKVAHASSVTFAGVTWRDVPVTLATAAQGATASVTSAATLGAGLLSRFAVTFDYARGRLLLVPNADAQSRPFGTDRLGITPLAQPGGFALEHVAPGSPAAAAGLKKGDVVVAVDGQPVGANDAHQRIREVVQKAAGTKVRFALAGGGEHTVVLADWY